MLTLFGKASIKSEKADLNSSDGDTGVPWSASWLPLCWRLNVSLDCKATKASCGLTMCYMKHWLHYQVDKSSGAQDSMIHGTGMFPKGSGSVGWNRNGPFMGYFYNFQFL